MANNISKAKAHLVIGQPFFASLLFGMRIIEDKSVKTLATDGTDLKYNPDFVEKLTLGETIFGLAHETLHCVFQHMCRRGSRNHNRYNIAADYVINDILVNEGVGSFIKGCLLDSALVKQGGGTTEGVYDLLPKESENKSAGDKGGALDDVQDAAQDQAGISEKEAEIKVKIIQAANVAKMHGKLSQGIERLVKELTATKTDWKAILRKFLSERAKVELSYARPKRRFIADDINLPSLTGEKLGAVVLAIDCSGSINDKLLQLFSSEVSAIIQDVMPSLTHVLYFDSKVLKHDTYGQDDTVSLKAMGGGGTAFEPIFDFIDSQDLNPVACIVLTDLEGSFGQAPSYPVLWASVLNHQAPFGEVVVITDN